MNTTWAGVALVLALVAPAAARAEQPKGQAAEPAWVREGFAEGRALAAVDLDGDGGDELVYGGRGVGLIDDETFVSHRPRWSVRWTPDRDTPLDGGDNTWTTGVATAEVTGDDVPDMFVTSSDTDAYLVDGATGAKLWHNPRTGHGFSGGLALIDADGDGVTDLFPTGGEVALSGRTGEVAWQADLPRAVTRAVTAELDGRPGRDVLVAHDPVGPSNLIAPSLYAFSGAGELLWSFGAVTVIHSLSAADLDGDGRDEAVIGNHNGVVLAIGAGGVRWAVPVAPSPVGVVTAFDTDGDGRDEVFAGTRVSGAAFDVVAFGAEGGLRWRHPVPGPVSVLQASAGRVLVGTGTAGAGAALSLAAPVTSVVREQWRVTTNGQVRAISALRQGGRDLVAFAGDEAVLRVVDAAVGTPVARWTSGDWLRTADAGDSDGDGRDEVVTGDARGHVMLVEHDGRVRWAVTPSTGRSAVSGVALLHGGTAAVVGVAKRYAPDEGSSTVAAWTPGGRRVWSTFVPGSAEALAVLDVDRDGVDDVLVAEAPSLHPDGDGCFVSAYDGRSGARRWRSKLADSCLVPHLAVDPDGRIAYGEQALFSVPHVALLGTDGSVRWNLEVPEATAWLDLVPGGVVHGGFASQARGHVTLREDAAGEVLWQVSFGSGWGNGPTVSGASRYGETVPDTNADGFAEVLTSSDDGTVVLLDGGSGEVRWASEIESRETPVTEAHASGPVALVGELASDPFVLAAQFATGQPIRGSAFVLGFDGARRSRLPLLGPARDIAVARHGAAIAAGHSLTFVSRP